MQAQRPVISLNKVFTEYRSVHVRWPGETGGAFGFALIFLFLFPSREKEREEIKFWIYNRWGELVFETSDPANGWNGIYKGQAQTTGVFVWMCNYQYAGEPLKQEKGTVVLIR